jgi:hypothetical protein
VVAPVNIFQAGDCSFKTEDQEWLPWFSVSDQKSETSKDDKPRNVSCCLIECWCENYSESGKKREIDQQAGPIYFRESFVPILKNGDSNCHDGGQPGSEVRVVS